MGTTVSATESRCAAGIRSTDDLQEMPHSMLQKIRRGGLPPIPMNQPWFRLSGSVKSSLKLGMLPPALPLIWSLRGRTICRYEINLGKLVAVQACQEGKDQGPFLQQARQEQLSPAIQIPGNAPQPGLLA